LGCTRSRHAQGRIERERVGERGAGTFVTRLRTIPIAAPGHRRAFAEEGERTRLARCLKDTVEFTAVTRFL
jgi:hypothetical protein